MPLCKLGFFFLAVVGKERFMTGICCVMAMLNDYKFLAVSHLCRFIIPPGITVTINLILMWRYLFCYRL
jgi:hypothetical protein